MITEAITVAAAKEGLELIQQFIELGKELAKLPTLVLPQYQPAAQDLYQICKKILTANENTARWLHRFRYFDFKVANARSNFLSAVQEYRALRTGPGFKELKFSCFDIGQIYYRHISSKLGGWFSNSYDREKAEGLFQKLTDADLTLVEFLEEHVFSNLDKALTNMEREMDTTGTTEGAERLRLGLKLETKETVQYLERFGDDLSDLVLKFAKLARVPITL
jgi:hypothetical protein